MIKLMVQKTGEGIVYRNAKPHVKSVHSYFPSVVDLGDGELLCAMVLGEAFESVDCRVHLSRSYDYGNTWDMEGRLLEEGEGHFSESCRLSSHSDGSITCMVFKYDRHRKDEGLANPDTLGFVENHIELYRSLDKGRSWSAPTVIEPPIVGPSFELCSPIVELSDGRWLLPTSTWNGWDGWSPTGMKAITFISEDGGRTWPDCIDVMEDVRDGIVYWEQKIIEMEPDKLLSVAWAYDTVEGKNLPNAYSIYKGAEIRFSKPQSTELLGETPSILSLGGNSVLCIYRRVDIPGLWAAVSSVENDAWKTIEHIPLWGEGGLGGNGSKNIVKQFNTLRFGAPHVTRLSNGDIYVVFWCVEDSVSNIRWIRLSDEY